LGRGRNQPYWDVSEAGYRGYALNLSRPTFILRSYEIECQLLEPFIFDFSM
jgi:hypothetical protein